MTGEIDREVHDIMETAHEVSKKVLEENKPRLVHLAERLLAKETPEGQELEAVFPEPLSGTPGRAETSPPEKSQGESQNPAAAPGAGGQ